jgi:hypothetical protein
MSDPETSKEEPVIEDITTISVVFIGLEGTPLRIGHSPFGNGLMMLVGEYKQDSNRVWVFSSFSNFPIETQDIEKALGYYAGHWVQRWKAFVALSRLIDKHETQEAIAVIFCNDLIREITERTVMQWEIRHTM